MYRRWSRLLLVMAGALLTCAITQGQDVFNVDDESDATNPPTIFQGTVLPPRGNRMFDHHESLPESVEQWFDEPQYMGNQFNESAYAWHFSGRGHRLIGTSWLNRPYHFDAFVGGLFGDTAINNQVKLGGAVLSGARLGWDFTDYWGSELRLALGETNLSEQNGTADVQFFDANLNWYPWGDSYVRPFVSLGSGLGRFSFLDRQGQAVTQVLYQLPVGIGVKCYFRRWLALRLELMNNIAFGASELNTMHNLSFTGGVELRFGGPRTSYFPFESNRFAP